MTFREPAWRVVARELESSLEEERGTGERAAAYVLSPFGARMNRVLLAGSLSPPEPIGRDASQPFWRSPALGPHRRGSGNGRELPTARHDPASILQHGPVRDRGR